MTRPQVRWMATYRDPEPSCDLLRETVRHSQQSEPYYETMARQF